MKFLVVNDDGIKCEGIKKLANTLTKFGEVIVVSPESERSAASCSFKKDDLTYESVEFDNIEAYQTNGMPVDCVSLGLYFNNDIDIVFSGVNNGYNLADDIPYSGTIGAAREAVRHKIPAVALSCDQNFEILDKYLEKLIKYILDNKLYSNEYILNVNFPNKRFTKINGIKKAKIGKKSYNTVFIKQGNIIKRNCRIMDEEIKDTDNYYSNLGYITITPLSTDFLDNKIYDLIKLPKTSL